MVELPFNNSQPGYHCDITVPVPRRPTGVRNLMNEATLSPEDVDTQKTETNEENAAHRKRLQRRLENYFFEAK